MKKSVRCLLWGIFFLLFHYQAFAQSKTVTGTVTSAEDNFKLPGVSIAVKGTGRGTTTDATGNYSINAEPTDVLVFSFIGMKPVERPVGNSATINVALQPDAKTLNEVVVTALGIKEEKKTLGYAVTEVKGAAVAETQRENFANALAGRVAGVEVATTSGLPGAGVSVMIRGVSSLSGSNQPLYVVDGLPISNRAFNSNNFAGGSPLDNRGVDYGNRGADINPADIETITILKGPEASALYGIDAASGAIVITTKRGKAGAMQINYSNSFRLDRIVKYPEIQQVYGRGVEGVSDDGTTITTYFGQPYASEERIYDNVKNFFQTSTSMKHNLDVSGGSEVATYRVAASYTDAGSFIPNVGQEKFNFTTSLSSKLNKYISTDVSLTYTKSDVRSVFSVSGGPMLGLLSWPSNDDASIYLDENGNRRRFSTSTSTTFPELENPYFNVNMNSINSANDRYILNSKIMVEPTSWFRLVGNVGYDYYTNKITQVRHPESRLAGSTGGIFDQSVDNDRNINIQYYGQLTKSFLNEKLTTDLKIGSAIYDQNNYVQSVQGTKFLAPGLYSIENTDPTTNRGKNRLSRRRLVGVFGSLNIGYNGLVYLSLTGRNDWTSTLPKDNNSFFYPSAGLSFIFTELAPLASFKDVLSYGKIRASVAQVGKDADPYMLRPWLESRTTTGGGFGYAFNGPSEALVPEMTTSYEVGAELKFFNDRLGLDFAYFKKKSEDQIVRSMRLSYGTGFVLKTFNAGEVETGGFEFQLNGTPIAKQDFYWDILANFSHNYSTLVGMPSSIPEYYNSDTWLYNNVRNGARIGGPVNSFTGYDYQRNDKGQILINPSTGYPLRDLSQWKVIGDRTPDFTAGLTNTFAYKNLSLSFLFEFRKGGDVFNATEHYLTVRGLSLRTLDRFEPRVFEGILKDGLENTDNPTKNNIIINPAWDGTFYASTSGEIDYVEKDINWVRLRDVTLRYTLPTSIIERTRIAKTASVFLTGTDLLLLTNYSGLDPVGSAVNMATGGSGGSGFDYGNLPMPMGVNVGLNIGF